MLKTSDNNFAVIALEDSQHIVFMLYRCLGQWENRSCLVKIGHWKSCRSVPFQGRKPGWENGMIYQHRYCEAGHCSGQLTSTNWIYLLVLYCAWLCV